MSDYISREALAKEMCKAICGEERNLCVNAPRNCHQRCMVPIYAAPTVQTEVRHGRWLQADDAWDGITTFQCSACGEEYCFEYAEDLSILNYNYCPHCGAKMDLPRGDSDD